MAELTQEKKGLDPKIPWIYFISVIGQSFSTYISGSYISFFMTERMMISAVTMGVVMLIARTGDLILGVASGAIVQKLQLKKGQYRSWLFYGPFIVAIGCTMLFINAPVPQGVKYVQVIIGYLGYGGAMSFMQISQNGMMAKISGPDVNARMSISAKVVQGQNTGRLLLSVVTLSLILFFDAFENLDGYTTVQLIFICIGITGQLVLYYGTKGYEEYDPNFKTTGSGSVKTTTMIASTLKNPQLILLMIADTARSTVTMSLAGLAAYYFRYIAGNMLMLTTYLTVSSLTGVLTSFIFPSIAKKIGKRNAGRLTGIVCIVAYFLLGFVSGSNPYLYIAFAAMGAAGAMIVTSVAAPMYLDCGEYQLYQTGVDNRTFVMSMYGVTVKLGFVFSSVIVSAVLEAGGYSAVEATIANPAMFTRMIGIVAVALYAVYLLVMFFGYKISEDKAKEYAEANHKMLQERAAAAKS